jgi:hypothetical protein
MNPSQKLSRDWRIGFQRNVPKLIWIGIIIALVGVFFGLMIANIFPPRELAGYEGYTFGFDMFALSRFMLYGGLGLVILGIFMYIITRFIKPGE